LNGGLILIATYGLYYTTLEFVAGLSWLLFIGVPMILTANLLRQVRRCDSFHDDGLVYACLELCFGRPCHKTTALP
jgi:hypothetical protein